MARRISGFTAIELLVVIAVVAILATLALPSFNAVVARYRVRTAVEDFTATIYFARSEAIRRGGGVVLRKATQAGCSAPEAKNWNCGWLVFADLNGNGTYDPNVDRLLQSTPAPRGVTVSNNNEISKMRLNQWGELLGIGAFSIGIQPAGNNDIALKTVLCMSAGGKLEVLPGAEACPG